MATNRLSQTTTILLPTRPEIAFPHRMHCGDRIDLVGDGSASGDGVVVVGHFDGAVIDKGGRGPVGLVLGVLARDLEATERTFSLNSERTCKVYD